MNRARDRPRKQDDVEEKLPKLADDNRDPFRIASRKLITLLRQNLAPIRHAISGETYDGIAAAIEEIEKQ
jgi:hypothetical protein